MSFENTRKQKSDGRWYGCVKIQIYIRNANNKKICILRHIIPQGISVYTKSDSDDPAQAFLVKKIFLTKET